MNESTGIVENLREIEQWLADMGGITTDAYARTVSEAIDSLQSPGVLPAVKVRALEWEYGAGNYEGQQVWSVGDPWLFWIVKNTDSDKFVWCETLNLDGFVPASPVHGSFDTLEEAQAAAQANFERRVLAALSPLPASQPEVEGGDA